MHVTFRADASHVIGTGHVTRCLTLAAALRDRGIEVSFVSRAHEGHQCDLIAKRGIPLTRLSGREAQNGGFAPRHHEALEAAWEGDAEETRAAIAATGTIPDWIVVDHYGLDHRWERAMRASTRRIMAIDDMAERAHDCDLLLDQNLVARRHDRYVGKVPPACDMLLGPDYALLQPAYGELHNRIPAREGLFQRLLVFFGGADNGNLTGRTLAAVRRLERSDLEIDVVFSPDSPHAEAVRGQIAGLANITAHSYVSSLAPLMARADIAVGAAGAASWERLCLGLPSLVITMAENQRPIAEELQHRGLVRWLGHEDVVDESAIEIALREVLTTPHDDQWSSRCANAVDGLGLSRVCAALTTTAESAMRTRIARAADEHWILDWAHDVPLSHVITRSRGEFRRSLRELDSCHFYVVENDDGAPVGCVRFERHAQTWEVRHAVAPSLRGRALDGAVLDAALLRLRDDEPGAVVLDGDQMSPGRPKHESWRISVCSDRGSWINTSMGTLVREWWEQGHQIAWVHDAAQLASGDICFFLSYSRIVDAAILSRHTNNLVVHASALPKGRGWSPLTWQILEGKDRIPVTLFEAVDAVDSGAIYNQLWIDCSGFELVDELRHALARATQQLCQLFVAGYPSVVASGVPQTGEPTFYARRRPADSQLDLDRPLREQFNLLRTVDSTSYPAWFELGNRRFSITIRSLGASPAGPLE